MSNRPPVLIERELWACAQQVIQEHGHHAPEHIAERVATLALDGDVAGVETWKRIADRVDQLSDHGHARQRTRH
ncbi:DUF6961 family protein [Sphingomonas arantia]|uniref:DUF6961 family protein n=1 Tax=Sphingomonas arantia TaxID=1460676 RepID=A0ABW4TXY8_9SPHN